MADSVEMKDETSGQTQTLPNHATQKSSADKATAAGSDKPFTLKKWNIVAMWSWDVECDTCAICRVQVMGKSR